MELRDDEMCVCGHELVDHHRSWFPGGGLLTEECEYFGFNETGGEMKNEEGHWVDHCMKFKRCDGSRYNEGCRCVNCVLRYSW